MKKSTISIHGGEKENSFDGAINVPIFQSSTFKLDRGAPYHDIKYMRLSNTPGHRQLHQKLAELESAEQAVVTASGMAAIATALLTVLRAGDHLLVQNSVYGGTNDFLREDLVALGISYDYVDPSRPEEWESKRRPNTKAFYVEALSNPLLAVGDLSGVVSFCKKHSLVSLIDNTFLTPALYRPAEHGFDLILHSATKALNGHSDIIAGVVAGKKSWVSKVHHKLNHLGGFLDVHTAFLLNRGLKTLFVRMDRQQENAQKLAEFLSQHPHVKKVHYPGLVQDPYHAKAKEWFDGFGQMLSFEIKGDAKKADQFIERLKLFIEAPSLGGVESLVTRPVTSSHSGLTPEERRRSGISEELIRVSVGLEDAGDLLADLSQALV